MTDTLTDAATQLAAAEQTGLEGLLALATKFQTDVTAIVTGMPAVPGYTSQTRTIGAGMTSNLAYQIGTQIPQLLAAYTPPAAPTPPASGSAS